MGVKFGFLASVAVVGFLFLGFFAAYPRTKYADGYSASAFRRVLPGMSTDEVYNLLGAQLCIESLGAYWPEVEAIRFMYSKDKNGGPFDMGWHHRSVLATNGVVVHRTAYLDWWLPWNRPTTLTSSAATMHFH